MNKTIEQRAREITTGMRSEKDGIPPYLLVALRELREDVLREAAETIQNELISVMYNQEGRTIRIAKQAILSLIDRKEEKP